MCINVVLVSLFGLIFTCGAYAREIEPNPIELLNGIQFELPEGVLLTYQDREVTITSDEIEYVVVSFIDELGRVQFTGIPTDSGIGINQIQGSLDVDSNDMPYLGFDIELYGGQIVAGSFTMTESFVLVENYCACSDRKKNNPSGSGNCTQYNCLHDETCRDLSGQEFKCKNFPTPASTLPDPIPFDPPTEMH